MEKLKARREIADAYKWHLEDFFANNHDWEKEFEAVEKLLSKGENFSGHLDESPEELIACLQWTSEICSRADELICYAYLRLTEDNRESCYQEMNERSERLAGQVDSVSAFVEPEILAVPPEKMVVMRQDPLLDLYCQMLDEIVRKREHVLSTAEEELLAEVQELAAAPQAIYDMANEADLKFPSIVDELGQEVELTQGNYSQFMESANRQVRRDAYQTMYGTYRKQTNSWAAMLNASVKSDVFLARVRKYSSALELSLDQDKVSLAVYNSLVETVHEYLPAMYRYVALRKKILGLDKLYLYDTYVPLVPDVKMSINYEEAKRMVIGGLQPLGNEYVNVLSEGFNSGWVDVYENEGKTSGAFSGGSYRSNPYVLLNHQDTLEDMLTIAHEMGHSLHSYYTNRAQPYIYSDYSIFVAEVASTVNEILVMEHLLKTTQDKKKQAYLINQYLDLFADTLFTQTMYAEFERETHTVIEEGGALNAENLSQMYLALNVIYNGEDIVRNDEPALGWAAIPHFYSAFYVYQYATGFSAAIALARGILDEGQPAVKRYLELLSSGCSDYPINLLRKAGVDMETALPVRNALDLFVGLVGRLEELLTYGLD